MTDSERPFSDLFGRKSPRKPKPEPKPEAPARARETDPDTSHAAARAVDGKVAGELQLACLVQLWKYREGLTAREIGHLRGVELGSITPRLVPLEANGLVARTDQRRVCQFTSKGRAGIVWRITPHGLDQVHGGRHGEA